MGDRGRYTLGEWVPLTVQCRDEDKHPVAPTAAPILTIYDSGWNAVATATMPPKDKPQRTGLFEFEQHLTGSFDVGHHTALYEWAAGSFSGYTADTFEVVPGGCSSGTYIGLEFYRRPDSDWLVGELDIGGLRVRKNPRI